MIHELNKLTKVLWSPKGGAFALALMATVLPACTNQLEANRPANEPGNVTTEEVTDNTNELIGQTVTIRSEPIREVDPNAFTISDQEFFGSESILVVNASGKPFTFPEDNDTKVQVTGEVRKLVVADLNREYDLDLDPDVYADYDDKPVIIAQALAPAPEPGEITEDPSQYYGRTLAATGEIETVYGPNAFTLNDEEFLGGEDLLVIVANPKNTQTAAEVAQDETVAVTGVLRPFVVAELEREYDLTWDLETQRTLEAEYKTKPILIVDNVYKSAVPEAAK
jgi:hypothetical protein